MRLSEQLLAMVLSCSCHHVSTFMPERMEAGIKCGHSPWFYRLDSGLEPQVTKGTSVYSSTSSLTKQSHHVRLIANIFSLTQGNFSNNTDPGIPKNILRTQYIYILLVTYLFFRIFP
ncbi:hypothetical protein F444_00618 [Phytophthora nicotianae P1976]|uniref:Uncharacterized protein n=1 Tax=Phytophthora nicotianae P1976 TaxID=1317066 RepID=A0A081B3Q9_PHYNI|nr:hypothetical protein F444_00618 [Phytophthora nicotianae P1976]